MLNSEQIHFEINRLGFRIEQDKSEPSYAYEHYLGNGKYLYIKRKPESVVSKAPLVLHPDCLALQQSINEINGVQITWEPTKNTSYRRFPKKDGASQYGYDATIETVEGLVKLLSLLTGSELTVPLSNNETTKKKLSVGNAMFPLNQILFGPPGTGKTYSTTELAVRIADTEWYEQVKAQMMNQEELHAVVKARYEQLVEEQRIMFTTFHQSFSYEDFIEGIRAQTDPTTGAIRYDVVDGIFKQLCTNSQVKTHGDSTELISLEGRSIWKMSLGNTLEDEDHIYSECIEQNYILLGYGKNIDYSGCNDRTSIQSRLSQYQSEPVSDNDYSVTSVNYFKNLMKIGDLVIISDGNQKFRAIAEITGEYQHLNTPERTGYQQLRKVKWLRIYEPSLPIERLFNKSLSQMTLYSLKSSTIDHTKLLQLLSTSVKQDDEARPYILIIDEINRGNISRIFGELITLLEPSKRRGASDSQSVILPYSKQPFTVPDNLYVIGTMNTADRSLAQLDLALRRRFSFIEIPPRPELLENVFVHGVNIATILQVINQRIEVLLNHEHMIGHAYFMPLINIDDEKEKEYSLKFIFKDKLIPLLQEYFFDDYERIGWVLNDPEKEIENRFIQTNNASNLPNIKHLFPSEIAEQLIDKRYRINAEAFDKPDAYKGIIK